jgi:hypothetical protein
MTPSRGAVTGRRHGPICRNATIWPWRTETPSITNRSDEVGWCDRKTPTPSAVIVSATERRCGTSGGGDTGRERARWARDPTTPSFTIRTRVPSATQSNSVSDDWLKASTRRRMKLSFTAATARSPARQSHPPPGFAARPRPTSLTKECRYERRSNRSGRQVAGQRSFRSHSLAPCA